MMQTHAAAAVEKQWHASTHGVPLKRQFLFHLSLNITQIPIQFLVVQNPKITNLTRGESDQIQFQLQQ